MNNYIVTSLAYGSSGLKSAVPIGFQPKGIRLTVAQKYNTTQNFAHQSVGMSDGTDQFYTTIYQDTTGGKTLTGDDKILSHWDRVSGTLTEVLSWELDSFNITGPAFNVLIASASYDVILEAWN